MIHNFRNNLLVRITITWLAVKVLYFKYVHLMQNHRFSGTEETIIKNVYKIQIMVKT